FIGKVRARVAAPATALALVQPQPVTLADIQRIYRPGSKPIDATIPQQQRTFVCRQRPHEVVLVDRAVENLLEGAAIIVSGLKPLYDGIHVATHFQRTGEGPNGLFFERCRPTIPEEEASVAAIEERWYVAAALPAEHSAGDAKRTRETVVGLVACGACNF